MKHVNNFKSFKIKDILTNSKIGTMIIIKKDNYIRKVYFRGFKNNKFWANYSNQLNPTMNDLIIYPNKNIKIEKIGTKLLIDKEEEENYITLRNIELDRIYKDAYKHAKQYPDPEEKDDEY